MTGVALPMFTTVGLSMIDMMVSALPMISIVMIAIGVLTTIFRSGMMILPTITMPAPDDGIGRYC